MIRYVCITTCFHKGIYYKPGEFYFALPDEEVPRHFIRPKEFVKAIPDIRSTLNPDQMKKVEEAVIEGGGEVPIQPTAEKAQRKKPGVMDRRVLPEGVEEFDPDVPRGKKA